MLFSMTYVNKIQTHINALSVIKRMLLGATIAFAISLWMGTILGLVGTLWN